MAKNLRIHETCYIFRKYNEEEYAALKESIAKHGVLEPVTTWVDDDGEEWVVDGRTRVEIANELGIDYPSTKFLGDATALIDFELDKNLNRRHLSQAEKAHAILIANEWLIGKGVTSRKEQSEIKERMEKARKRAGVGSHMMAVAKRALANKPELAEQLRSGEKTQRQVIAELRKDAEAMSAESEADERQGDEQVVNLKSPMEEWNERQDSLCKTIRGLFSQIAIDRDESRREIIKGVMDRFIAEIKHDKGYAICPYCQGKKCDRCRGRGWLNKVDYDSVPRGLRESAA